MSFEPPLSNLLSYAVGEFLVIIASVNRAREFHIIHARALFVIHHEEAREHIGIAERT